MTNVVPIMKLSIKRTNLWTMLLRFTQCCANKKAQLPQRQRASGVITPFKVMQGHQFWYQSKAHFLLANILTCKHPTSHRLPDIVQYWWNYCFQQGFLSRLSLMFGEIVLTHDYENWRRGTRNITLLCDVKCISMSWTIWTWFTSVTDGRTDRTARTKNTYYFLLHRRRQ